MKPKRFFSTLLAFLGFNACTLDTSLLRGTGHQDSSVQRYDSGSVVIPNLTQYDGSSPKQNSQDLGVDAENGCYINPLDSLEGIVIRDGEWSIHPEGYLQQTELGSWKKSYINRIFSDFDATVQVRLPIISLMDRNMVGIIFRYSIFGSNDEVGYHLFVDHNGDSRTLGLVKLNNINNVPPYKLLNSERVDSRYGAWQNLRVRAIGNTIETYFNGNLIFTIENDSYLFGYIGFESYNTVGHYRNLVVCEE